MASPVYTLQAIWAATPEALAAEFARHGRESPATVGEAKAVLAMLYYNDGTLDPAAQEWVAKTEWLSVMSRAETLEAGLRIICGPYLLKLFTLIASVNLAESVYRGLITADGMDRFQRLDHAALHRIPQSAEEVYNRIVDPYFQLIALTGYLRAFNEDLGVMEDLTKDSESPVDAQEVLNIASTDPIIYNRDAETQGYLAAVNDVMPAAERVAVANRLAWRVVALAQSAIEAKMMDIINQPGVAEWMTTPFSTSAIFDRLMAASGPIVTAMPPTAVCVYLALLWDIARSSELTPEQATWMDASLAQHGCERFPWTDLVTRGAGAGASPLSQLGRSTFDALKGLYTEYVGAASKDQAMAASAAAI